MSISKDAFKLNRVYELINAGCIKYNNDSDPGEIYIWGINDRSQLGVGDKIHRSSPTQIPGTAWLRIGSGSCSAMAIKTDGTLWNWGYNSDGQLGDNTVTERCSPVQVPGTQWCEFGLTAYNHFGIKTDGTLWGWGYNAYGTLADNTLIKKSSPIQIPGNSWVKVSGGLNHVLALKTDGTLWGWGENQYGAVGDNTTIHRSSPVQVTGTWKYLIENTNRRDFAAIKLDGTLWTWGENGYGHLGVGDISHRTCPIQVPGNQWVQVAMGYETLHGLKSDGTLWAAGFSENLGDPQNLSRSSPIQIPGVWCCVSNANTTLAKKVDGTLWTWGRNCQGEIGLNIPPSIPISCPVQIPGLYWSSLSNGYNTGFAKKVI